MHSAKEKAKDMGGVVKEKVKEGTAKAEEKSEKVTAHSREEKEIAHERAKVKEAGAKVELHEEKAEHKADTAGYGYGTARVPLTKTANPTYPTTGTHPASEKYL